MIAMSLLNTFLLITHNFSEMVCLKCKLRQNELISHSNYHTIFDFFFHSDKGMRCTSWTAARSHGQVVNFQVHTSEKSYFHSNSYHHRAPSSWTVFCAWSTWMWVCFKSMYLVFKISFFWINYRIFLQQYFVR